jgi:hypothetical protein
MMNVRDNSGGYIALMVVLVVSVAATAIALGLLLTGTDNQRATLVSQQSVQARQLAHACAEEALQAINANRNFTGTANLSLTDGSCTYTVINTGGAGRIIDTSSTINNVVRKVKVYATIGTSSISITSWQEVADS